MGVVVNNVISRVIAMYPEHGNNNDEILHHADLTIYNSKKDAKGKIYYYDK